MTAAGRSAPAEEESPPLRRSAATRIAAWSPAILGAAFLFQAVRTGLPAASAGRALLVVLITQLLPGVLIWRCVRPLRGWWLEDLSMGLAVGIVVAVAAQTLAGEMRVPAIAGGLGVGVAALLVGVPTTRRRISEASTTPLPVWWTPAVSATALFGVQQLHAYYRNVPLSWPSGFRAPYNDTYFHLSVAAELAHRGPVHFPWVVSEPLAYHWFSHAWIAQVSVASGAALDEVLLRFTPALMPLVVTCTVATAAIRLSGRLWTGPLAAVLTMAGSDLNVFGRQSSGYPLSPLSPSVALSAPALIGVVVVLALHWRRALRPPGLMLVPVLTFAATGIKGSTAPLLVAGLALATVAMAVVNRAKLPAVLLHVVLVLGAMVLAVVTVFRGSDAGLHIAPLAAIRKTPAALWIGDVQGAGTYALVAAVTMVAVLARGVGLLALVGDRDGRRDPLTWLLTGAGLAGGAAVLAFAHPGNSQWYFLRSADPLLALGSALGLAVLLQRLGARARSVVVIGLVAGPILSLLPPQVFGDLYPLGGMTQAGSMLLIALAVLLLTAAAAVAVAPSRALGTSIGTALAVTLLTAGVTQIVASQITTRPPPDAASVPAYAPLAVSRDQVDAARWIRDHSDVDDLVMTNRHCTTPREPRGCDSRRFVVAAFSERQVLLEGWSGSARATAIAPKGRNSITVDYWHPDLLRLNDGFIARPDGAALRRLRDLGVRWVFVDHTRPYATTLAPYAVPRFRNAGVDVYEIPPVDEGPDVGRGT